MTSSSSHKVEATGLSHIYLVADPDRLAQIVGAAGDANAHLIGFVRMRGHKRPVQEIDADQVEAQLAGRDTGQLQPLADDLQRQPAARQTAPDPAYDIWPSPMKPS